jgi:uncharacterized protein
MSKPIGPLCNLECTYCFYLEKDKLYPARPAWRMSDKLLESYIRDYIASQSSPVVNFAWQGGEPTLLGVEFFRRAVALQQLYAGGKRIENALQTNGILLDDNWGEFLSSNHFLVGLSIDGPREIHDQYRVDKGGQPTFERVMRGLAMLKKHGVEYNTLTVVQRHNSRFPLDVYRFLREEGSGFMQFIPIVERVAAETEAGLLLVSPDSERPARISDWSVEPLGYGEFLCAIFDEWARNDVGRCFVQIFDVCLEAWFGMEPSLCVFRETCGEALIVEHNGDIYSCDHYVYPENRLGNILEGSLDAMAGSEQQLRFGLDKRDRLPRSCRECEFLFICHGECPKHRFATSPGGEAGMNYLCPGYKLFFRHVDPFMKFMAEQLADGKPPANVMRWSRERDLRAAGKRHPGRNEPCICGSGKKFKKCCGGE